MAVGNSKPDPVSEQRPEPTVALNPLTGLDWNELRTAARKTALKAATQPLLTSKHLAAHSQKLIEVLFGTADYQPDKRDPRFQDDAWKTNGIYQRLMKSYLAMNESLEEWVDDLNLSNTDKLRAEFVVRVLSDSISPSNSILGNPEVFRTAMDTRGDSLVRGARNLWHDIRHNHGMPSQVKSENFAIGENIATTPGAVVFRNEVLELIQYQPRTSLVYRRPLLIVSAMINKFYVLDLTPDRSLIRYCLEQGQQVFVVSWVNPGQHQSDLGIEAYSLAVIEAVAAIKSITRSQTINLFTLCSGAMAMSAMATYLKEIGDRSIHSMTVGVCMLDMQSDDMEMSAFASDDVFERVKQRSAKAGVLRGHQLASSMLWMRPQDLIWANVVNNYLLGNEPPEFDLLFWNNDWTNLPAQLHADVIDMFARGTLDTPGGMTIDGVALDLSVLDCDKFVVAGESDHITPWKACYRTALKYAGEVEFLLSNSGHMQTLLNSPHKKRSSYFINPILADNAEQWRDKATLEQGSWWGYWSEWIDKRSGAKKTAPKSLGNRHFPAGDHAPGSYVFQQSSDV